MRAGVTTGFPIGGAVPLNGRALDAQRAWPRPRRSVSSFPHCAATNAGLR